MDTKADELRDKIDTRVDGLGDKVDTKTGGLEGKVDTKLDGLRSEVREDMGEFRSEVREDMGGIRSMQRLIMEVLTRFTGRLSFIEGKLDRRQEVVSDDLPLSQNGAESDPVQDVSFGEDIS